MARAAHIHDARWASEFAPPVVRHQRGYDHAAVGIWSSGSLMTVQLQPVDSADWHGDSRLWAAERLRVRALGAQGSALQCAVASCLAPAMSTCRHMPERCEARRCAEGCIDDSDEALTGCLCMESTDESHCDEGSPLDLEARSSDWGPVLGRNDSAWCGSGARR